jgi:hypothetical protein
VLLLLLLLLLLYWCNLSYEYNQYHLYLYY